MAGLVVLQAYSWLPGEDPITIRVNNRPADLLGRAANRLAHCQVKPNYEARDEHQAAAHNGCREQKLAHKQKPRHAVTGAVSHGLIAVNAVLSRSAGCAELAVVRSADCANESRKPTCSASNDGAVMGIAIREPVPRLRSSQRPR